MGAQLGARMRSGAAAGLSRRAASDAAEARRAAAGHAPRPEPVPFGDEELERLAPQIKDHNYRICSPRVARFTCSSAGLHLADADPFMVFEQLIERGPRNLDPAHAFYLGYEMAKAVTALTLGKEYRQDEALDWGFLTRPETSHRQTRIGPPADAQASHESTRQCRQAARHDPVTGHELRPCPISGPAKSTIAELAESVAAVEELLPAPDPEDVFLRLAASAALHLFRQCPPRSAAGPLFVHRGRSV